MKKNRSETPKGRSTSKSRSGQKPDGLREQAEKRLSERSTPMPLQDAQQVLQELEVHQIELEMQNENLRQAQGTITASQERYAEMYDFAPIGYFTFDHTGLITEVNLPGSLLLGVERGQLKSKPFSLFVAAPFRDTFHRYYRGVLKTGTADMCEVQLTRKDGTSFYVLVQSVPIRDGEGNVTGIRSAISDITERKQAEEALRESEEHYRSLFDNMLNGFAYCKTLFDGNEPKDFTYLNVNSAFEALTGLKDVIGKKVSEVIPGIRESDPELFEIYGRVTLTGTPERFERYVKALGMWFSISVYSPRKEYFVAIFDVITERKRTEEELLRAKEAWERTFASVPDLIAILDNQHQVLRVNEAMARRLGVEAEEAAGLRCYEVVHGLSGPPDYCPHSRTIKDGQQHIEEVHEDRLGGDFVVSTTPLHDDKGQMIGTVHVAHDITKRKQAEESLRESEKRMSRAQEIAHLGSWELDVVNNRLSWSDEVYRIFGLQPQEFGATYDAFLDAVHPDDRAAVDAAYSGSLRAGRDSYEIEHRVIRKSNGEVRFVHEKCEHIRDEAGQIIRSVGMVHDITEQKKAEEALQKAHDELEQRVRERTAELSKAVDTLHDEINERRKGEEDLARQAELLNLTHDAIIARDLNQKVFFWNRGAEERYGWSGDEVKGKVTDDFLHTVFPQPRQEIEEELLLRGRWEGEVVHTTRDDRKITVASRRALRRDEDGKPISILEINSDVTEQRRIEEQLRQSQKMEAVGTLAGGIAHDFNNILAAIIGFTEMAFDDVDQGSQLERNLERVLKSGMRARDLVKQILAFSRMTAKERKPLQLSNAVEEARKLLVASLPSTVDLRFTVKSESGTVLADSTQIQQVVMNLCTNAVQAMEDKGLLKITLSDFSFESPREAPAPDMEPGAYLRLSVSDTGHGMSKEVMEHLFDPFFTTKGPGQGTGLGLSVVHGIVKSHDGAITVESEPGKGSTLTVYLPKLEKKTTAETDKEASAPTGTERILFIDDEDLIVEMGEDMLKGLGYRVVPKTNGREALDLFKANPEAFDLIITDQTMPHLTGVELARAMIGIRSDIPIILATGYSQRVDADSARAAGIRAFVMKPLTRSEIAHTIREVLDPGEKKV